MPSIHLLGRPWGISSDDFPIPAASLMTFHLGWLLFIGILERSFREGSLGCSATWTCHTYLVALLCLFLLSICMEVAMILEGCKGVLDSGGIASCAGRKTFVSFALCITHRQYMQYSIVVSFEIMVASCDLSVLWHVILEQ